MSGITLTSAARTLVVGDIHGCFDELIALIAAAGLSETDRIVSVGDLIDRGPKPWEVVEFFRARPATRYAVRGNHEWKHISHAGKPDIPSRAGRVTRRAIGELRYADAIAYFNTLPLWIELPEVLVVHAGVDATLPLDATDPKLLMGVNSGNRPGFDEKSPWWFDGPDLEVAKPIVFGHHVFPDVVRGHRNNVWGINTGAGYGGALTGLLLPEFRIISVPAPNYVASIPRRWEGEDELRKIPLLAWGKLFKLLASPTGLPAPAHALVEEAHKDFDALVARLTEDGLRLRTEYKAYDVPDLAKRAFYNTLRDSPRFTDPYGACLLAAMKGHDVRNEVIRRFPTWDALKTTVLF
jgi:hypothetical protein